MAATNQSSTLNRRRAPGFSCPIRIIPDTPCLAPAFAARELLAFPVSRHGKTSPAKRPPGYWRAGVGTVYSGRSTPDPGANTMPASAAFRRALRRLRLRLERLDDRTLPSVARLLALGAETGRLPQVRLIDPSTGQEQSSMLAYDPAF